MSTMKRLLKTPARPSPLLQLPVELRLMICDLFFNEILRSLPWLRRRHAYPLPPLFRVCRLLRNEGFQPWLASIDKVLVGVRASRAATWRREDLKILPFASEACWTEAWQTFDRLFVTQKQLLALRYYTTVMRTDAPGIDGLLGQIRDPNRGLLPWPESQSTPPMSLAGRDLNHHEFARRVIEYHEDLMSYALGADPYRTTRREELKVRLRRLRRNVAARFDPAVEAVRRRACPYLNQRPCRCDEQSVLRARDQAEGWRT